MPEWRADGALEEKWMAFTEHIIFCFVFVFDLPVHEAPTVLLRMENNGPHKAPVMISKRSVTHPPILEGFAWLFRARHVVSLGGETVDLNRAPFPPTPHQHIRTYTLPTNSD